MVIDKILKVSNNLVFVYFVNAPMLTIATNDGTAYEQAMTLVKAAA